MPDVDLFQEGYAAHRAGDLDRAAQRYAAVLALQPAHVDALHMLGLLNLQQGRSAQAAELLARAVALKPGFIAALLNLGNALKALGRLDEALARYQEAFRCGPVPPAAHGNLGSALLALGRHEEAIAQFGRLVALQPEDAAAHNQLGHALAAALRHAHAVPAFRRALALRSPYPGASSNLGLALAALGQHREAMQHFQDALAVAPDFTPALLNLGHTLIALDRHDKALAPLKRLAELDPSLPAGQFALGCALAGAGQRDAARAHLRQAVVLAPGLVQAWLELGTVAYAEGDFDAARSAFDTALRHAPDFAAARYNRGLCALLDGDYARGWPAYEARWGVWRDTPPPTGERGLGEASLAGRTVLLYAEQGYGDTLQFVRYVPLVAQRGARVVVEVQPELAELLEASAQRWGVRVLARGTARPACDFYCPLGSLPQAFATRLDTIPFSTGYLEVPAPAPAGALRQVPPLQDDEQRKDRAPRQRPRRIGIVWAGARRGARENRALPVEALGPLFRLPGFSWVVLQTPVTPAEAAWLTQWPTVVRPPMPRNFADTAAWMASLDAIVSVDTASAHLAGALGRPLWLMLPFAPDWRWLLARADSPWYAHARLVRQAVPGAWDRVVEQVASALVAAFPPAPPALSGVSAGVDRGR